MKWISVKDKMPDEGKDLLLFRSDRVMPHVFRLENFDQWEWCSNNPECIDEFSVNDSDFWVYIGDIERP